MSLRLAQLIAVLCALGSAGIAVARDQRSLGDLSIEELMNESITSVSKHDQKLGDAAAAVTVLTNEDLRRSGVSNIADALRLVPGMDVGALNASRWAVSTRGFNNIYANKLLVLIDGRIIYTPMFAGVFWDLQQPLLDDIERIEVIRGPGATVWGANAVNGVVNIITRRASDTQGALVYAGGGEPQQVLAGGRYGGHLNDDTAFRVYATHQENDDAYLPNSRQSAGDRWRGVQTGFSVERQWQEGARLTWQSDFSGTDFDASASHAHNVNTLARWTQPMGEKSELELRAYYDQVYRAEVGSAESRTDTADLSVQHTFTLGERNDLTWSAGYRHIHSSSKSLGTLAIVRHPHFAQQVFSAFLQDELKLIPDKLMLTGGVMLERNDFTGLEIQPSLRLAYKPASAQTLWSAVSRSVRTPRVLEGYDMFAIFYGAPFQGPGGGFYLPTLVGNPQVDSEVLWAYELGYRIQVTPQLSIDAATFYNDYDRLIAPGAITDFVSMQPVGLAEVPWVNLMHGETHGGELTVQFSPGDAWRFTFNYSLLFAHLHGGATDLAAREHSSPERQASLRASHDFSSRLSVDAQLRYVGAIDSVSSYVTADARIAYPLSPRWELALIGQNLLEPSHAEQAPLPGSNVSQVRRGAYLKVTGRF